MSDIKKTISQIEQGEAWDETDEVVELEIKKPLDKVIPIRLSADKWELIRREAKDLGIGPTTLARMWILERLRQNTPAQQSGDSQNNKKSPKNNRSKEYLAAEQPDTYNSALVKKKAK